ncbi:MAG TPA: Mov34/MPN/PAD-1 family protein [Bryobacteraceae bacterium]|nr:Mov34/MPN/PAD-1 family protein [Bryobacteraceae bacterium]
MTGETAEISLPLSGAQHSTLRYRAAVMEGLRRHAVDKFMSIPRGGLEVGGLLLGRVDGETIEVNDSEEFVVDYTNGPSYRFTAADTDKLRQRLQTSPEQVVGWWHSHTRSEIDLSEEDLSLHREFWPAAHTVALVIKPFKFDPAQVAVYLPNSSSDPLAACARFALEGPKPKPREALVAASSPVVVPIARRNSQTAAVSRGGHRRRAYAAVAGLVAVLLGAAWLAIPSRPPDPPPQTLGLTLSNTADQLTVRWDRNAELIQSSVGGELIITDGPQTTRIPLAIDSLTGGTLAYMRRSGKVEVRLRARSRDNELHEDVAHFVGPEPQPRPEPITVERQTAAADPNVVRMKAEMERLNGELARMRTAPAERAASRPAAPPQASVPVPQAFTAPPPNIAVAPAATSSSSPSVPLPQVSAAPPPTAAPVAQPQPQQAPAKPTQLSRGRAIWTGMLPRGAVLAFDGRRPSSGALTGRMPDGPSRVRVYPGDLREAGIVVYTQGDRERIESPSAANGWNLTTYKPDAKRARDVAVLETPSAANNWQRILVRSEQRPISILVVEWEEVAR